MRVMCLDIGEKRCGVAVSDATGTVASPLGVVATCDVLKSAPPFRRMLEDYEPALLLCGLPLTLAGEEGPQAARVRACAEQVSAASGIDVAFADERLSTHEARRVAREAGANGRAQRGKLDALAATVVLQTYLDTSKA
ncbi:MAG: Holliday junction resolvase RuvX [Coriobacteriales bacterium]|nr:Holliday junction resolvase RuvX [Coriobacteriales bacterium]